MDTDFYRRKKNGWFVLLVAVKGFCINNFLILSIALFFPLHLGAMEHWSAPQPYFKEAFLQEIAPKIWSKGHAFVALVLTRVELSIYLVYPDLVVYQQRVNGSMLGKILSAAESKESKEINDWRSGQAGRLLAAMFFGTEIFVPEEIEALLVVEHTGKINQTGVLPQPLHKKNKKLFKEDICQVKQLVAFMRSKNKSVFVVHNQDDKKNQDMVALFVRAYKYADHLSMTEQALLTSFLPK